MHTVHEKMKVWLVAGVVAVTLVACGKKDEEQPTPPPAEKQAEPTKSKPKPVASSSQATTTVVPKPDNRPPVMPTPAGEAGNVSALEAAYVSNPDFTKRVETIYKISDAGTPEAITSLGRLFHTEKDPDLKTEIVDSLFDIDGLDDRKIALLTAAAMADQPKDVRESAIDALGDLEAKYALPILQSLLSDPDEDIREQAKDQIEMLQSQQALQK